MHHAAVDDVGKVALQDPDGLFFGVAPGSCVLEDLFCPRVAAELGDRHAVQDGVDPAVAAAVHAVAFWLPLSLPRGGGQGGGPVEPGEASFPGKAPWVAD